MKRFLSLLLVIIIAGTLFAGCKKEEPAEEQAPIRVAGMTGSTSIGGAIPDDYFYYTEL